MSAATLTLSRVRIKFRKSKPPSPRQVWRILMITIALLYVLKEALLFVNKPNPLDLILGFLWAIVYFGHRFVHNHERRREERLGLPYPPPPRSEWIFLVAITLLLALPPW